jgi:hypothetical protein
VTPLSFIVLIISEYRIVRVEDFLSAPYVHCDEIIALPKLIFITVYVRVYMVEGEQIY